MHCLPQCQSKYKIASYGPAPYQHPPSAFLDPPLSMIYRINFRRSLHVHAGGVLTPYLSSLVALWSALGGYFAAAHTHLRAQYDVNQINTLQKVYFRHYRMVLLIWELQFNLHLELIQSLVRVICIVKGLESSCKTQSDYPLLVFKSPTHGVHPTENWLFALCALLLTSET